MQYIYKLNCGKDPKRCKRQTSWCEIKDGLLKKNILHIEAHHINTLLIYADVRIAYTKARLRQRGYSLARVLFRKESTFFACCNGGDDVVVVYHKLEKEMLIFSVARIKL